MYRSLCQASRYDCKDMDGFLTLLLVWPWIWMPLIGPLPVDTSFPLAPSGMIINPLSINIKIGQPLTSGEGWMIFLWMGPNRFVPHVIPLEINDVVNLWSAIVPLICFEVVELHPTNKVRKQFGFYQDPSGEAMQLKASHNIVLMGPKNKNWGQEHGKWISQWNNSSACVLTGQDVDNYQPSDKYMD
ncbi:uncharacterized protein DS421_3g83150 [Arachis hypogaea]|nr:uncharacterized protein DS421_3g83150 [Arachis hypogaea]